MIHRHPELAIFKQAKDGVLTRDRCKESEPPLRYQAIAGIDRSVRWRMEDVFLTVDRCTSEE